MTKLAQGHLDLHSSRTLADPKALAFLAEPLGLTGTQREKLDRANSIAQGYAALGDERLGTLIAEKAANTVRRTLDTHSCKIDVAIFDRQGQLMGKSGIF